MPPCPVNHSQYNYYLEKVRFRTLSGMYDNLDPTVFRLAAAYRTELAATSRYYLLGGDSLAYQISCNG